MTAWSRRVVVTEFGGPEVLAVDRVPVLPPGRGQVSVRVQVAGVNPVDWKIFAGGATADRFGVRPPFGNGNDFAGVIDAVGDGVQQWRIGDRVYGGARFSAQADQLIVTDLSTLNRTPDRLDPLLAGVLDIAGRTALAGIAALALDRSDTLLVGAAAGGVGLIAAQLAVRTGATVIGTAGQDNLGLLADLGVEPLDRHTDLLESLRGKGISAVFDAQGRTTIELGLALGVPPARINSVADRSAALSLGAISVGRATTPTSVVRPVAELFAAGDLVLPVAEYPLADVAAAYRRSIDGHLAGKLALRLSD